MSLTYQRNVDHCDKSNYVKKVTVASVTPAENSDNLDIIKFAESGWQALVARGSQDIGNSVLFIPPESILPLELSEALGVTNYLGKGRVKVTRLRGNRSEGLVVNEAIAAPYLDGILQWEDPPDIRMQGQMLAKAATPFDFEQFYKMPNLMNEPGALIVGERVRYSEKIHGTNVRFGRLECPETGEFKLFVGSHRTVRKREGDDLYWRVVLETLAARDIQEDALPAGVVFYGEIYGAGIQDMQYGLKNSQQMLVFNASRRGQYMAPSETVDIAWHAGLQCVKFHTAEYCGLDWAREISETPSEMYDGIREGIVIVSDGSPNRMAKVVSGKYLERKGKRTEKH